MKPRMHHLTVVAISEVLPQDQAAYPSASKIADLVCSCGQAFRVIDTDTPRLAPLQPQPTCFNPYDLRLAIFAIQREDVQPGHVNALPPRDIDGEPLAVGDFVEMVNNRHIIGYVDRITGLNALKIRQVAVITVAHAQTTGIGIVEGSTRGWRRLEAFDGRVAPAYEAMRTFGVLPDQPWHPPTYQPEPIERWWVLWCQRVRAEDMLNPVPLNWPPPSDVLAYWWTFRTVTPGVWVDATYATIGITALCRGTSPAAIRCMLREAWGSGFVEDHFIVPYPQLMGPPAGFHPPEWSLRLKRWPWPPKEAAYGG